MSDIRKIGLLLRDIGPIEGRKKFQKIVYVLQETGVDFETRYELTHFGPYSSELKGSIDELVAARLIDAVPQESGRMRFSITHAFANLLERAASNVPADWSEVARDLNNRDAGDLEGISTILFLESRGWDDGDLDGCFKTLKPDLSDRFERLLDTGRGLKKKREAARA